jgi:putative hemolysin
MKISTRKQVLFSGTFALLLLGGCSATQEPHTSAAIANPASEYCAKKGGKIEIVKDEAGEKGMCHLPDGTVVEEWELFRRDHPQP